jgi:hypothetical protein
MTKEFADFYRSANRKACIDNNPVSCFQLGKYFHLDGKQLQQQYKDHISDYWQWPQREHAEDRMLYPNNTGVHLSMTKLRDPMENFRPLLPTKQP